MNIDITNLREILLKANYITEEDAQSADDFMKDHDVSFVDFLLDKGLINKDLLGQAVAEAFRVPYTNLSSSSIPQEQIQAIPEKVARQYKVILVSYDDKSATVATDAPLQDDMVSDLKNILGRKNIEVTYSLPDDIDELFVYYQKSLDTRFAKILEKKQRIAPEILDEIFDDALVYKASDIHFEPHANEIVIRFRVDGVLHEAGRFPKDYYDNILNRIKVKSGLRIDEHFSAQDGSLRYEKNDKIVDMRTSIVPTVEGEKVAIRILAAYIQGLTMMDLGLSSANQEMLQIAVKKPFGMILVTGPTGSGKTTTLYALLKILNNSESNITTIEDPVEYRIMGVNQIQVNQQTNLTFAKGLRSIVRQDPDVILVGEIRDSETAEIAVNAALTGHLLLSTFHANDAATALPRLIDMGIEPFLLASTVNMIIAQRLVRKICDNCRYSVTHNKAYFDSLEMHGVSTYFPNKTATLYEGKGCDACGHTGYKGRTAIFEFLNMTSEMQELIVNKPATQDILKLAYGQGSESLFEDGILKVKNGITTIEELLRVAEPPRKHHK